MSIPPASTQARRAAQEAIREPCELLGTVAHLRTRIKDERERRGDCRPFMLFDSGEITQCLDVLETLLEDAVRRRDRADLRNYFKKQGKR